MESVTDLLGETTYYFCDSCWHLPSHGGVEPWPTDQYLNIYVADMGLIPGASIGAYGVAVRPFALNEPETTLTHEVGHYFGLYHVDEDDRTGSRQCEGETAETCLVEGDRVCDTPAFATTQPGYCPGDGANTCVDVLPAFSGDPPDPYENYMVSSTHYCESMFTFGQADVMHSQFVLNGGRHPLLGSNAFSVPVSGADLWIRDGAGDDGSVPSATPNPWASNDIWVRRTGDGVAIHENPLYGSDNRVYVRVRNRGCDQPTSGQVRVYWAKASTSLAWPNPWTGEVFLDEARTIVMGGLIGEQSTGTIAAGESTIIEIPWSAVPNPADYAEYGADQTHFCLLAFVGDEPAARIELPALVSGSNDIAWRNVNVAGEDDAYDSYVFVGGTEDATTHRLVFEVPEDAGTAGSIFDWGTVYLELRPELYGTWAENGELGSGFWPEADGRIRLSPGAILQGIGIDPAEFSAIRLTVEPNPFGDPVDRTRLDVYFLDVIQYAELGDPGAEQLRLVGVQRTQFKLQTPIYFVYPPE